MFGFSSLIYAAPPKPAKCPNVDQIKAVKLLYASSYTDGYTVMQLNNYNTSDTWAFAFTSIQATSSQEALKIGNQWLSSLSGAPSPKLSPDQKVRYCLYTTSEGAYGVAITPIDSLASLNQSILSVTH